MSSFWQAICGLAARVIRTRDDILVEVEDAPLRLKGHLTVILHDATTGDGTAENPGIELERHEYPNLITKAGKRSIANRLTRGGTAPGYPGTDTANLGMVGAIAVGTSTVAPTDIQTALLAELASNSRVAIAAPPGGSYYSENVTTFRAFFNSGQGNGALKEAGLFGDLISPPGSKDEGTLYSRVNININKDTTKAMTFLWSWTIG